MEAWEEATSRPQSSGDYPELEEEAEAFDDQPKLRWSLGVRKKEEWEEKPFGVTREQREPAKIPMCPILGWAWRRALNNSVRGSCG